MADSSTTWSLITAYIARGWRPVPLHHVLTSGACSCRKGADCRSQGKHPIYENWQKLLLSEHTLRKVLDARPQMNLGIATGRPSGFWALDVDDAQAARALAQEYGSIPSPPFQFTGSGGWHHLFELPPDFEPTNSAGRLPPGIDVRGTGGQIVVPPSVSAKGAYRLVGQLETAVQPNPPWLLELVRPLPYAERGPAAPIDMASDDPDVQRAWAYAARIVQLECAELAGDGSGRNTRAFKAACRLHELINADWVAYDQAEAEYLNACERASSNKLEPFPESEAREVWAHAAMRVGDKQAELPPSAIGGERLDFPVGTMAPSSSSTAAAPLGQPSLENLLSSGLSLSMSNMGGLSGSTHPEVPPQLNLPPEFWEVRPVLKHIRDAAHSRIVSADVAFYTVLARLAAMWPHKVRLDTGVKSAASANLFVAICGPSGIGKTSGISVAQKLLEPPPWMAGEHRHKFADDMPLGTGEGIAEAFMGSAKRPALDDKGEPLLMRDGQTPKLESVRTQVLHNLLVHADEGEAMAKLVERSGSTIGETLRRAWVGETIGQSNGRAETTRIIHGGRYSLGLVVGFQEETAQPLLADEAAGTPQRFLWCWVVDPSMTGDDTGSPGPLTDVWPAAPEPPQVPGTPWLIDPAGANDVDLRPVIFPPEVKAELRAELLARQRGELTLPRQDAHRPLMLVKLAALLAQLDGGRRRVDLEDWRLARIVWDTSSRVRDHLIAHGMALAGKAAADRRAAFAGDHAAAESARLLLHDDRERAQVTDLAHWAARKVLELGPQRETDLRRRVGSRRHLLSDALTLAVELSLLGVEGDAYVHGAARLPS
jgi:hypothetical protein